jgi:hypothetical protein
MSRLSRKSSVIGELGCSSKHEKVETKIVADHVFISILGMFNPARVFMALDYLRHGY